MERNKTEALTELLMITGEMLLENGAETFRVENSILSMFYSLNDSDKINIVALGTQLTLDIYDGKHHIAVKRIRRRSVNLEKLARINDIVRKVTEGKIGINQAFSMLRDLNFIKTGNRITQILATALFVSGMFVLMIGGSLPEVIIAFVCCLIYQSLLVFVKKSASIMFVAIMASGFMAALIASLGTFIWDGSVERIIFGALLPLFPGVAMMNAIRDTVNGDLASGVVRGVDAVLTAVGLALGTSLGLIFIAFFGEFASSFPTETKIELPYTVFALLVSFGSGLMLNAKYKEASVGAIIGGIVYAVFILCAAAFNEIEWVRFPGTTMGVFVASLTLAALSEIGARILKVPATIFLIMGVYPLVPGAGIYKTATLILQNNVPEALMTGNSTVAELLFMVAGIAIVSVFFKMKLKDSNPF
jgi:uncharacterized membrane protein YjjP (DUF1212 family)